MPPGRKPRARTKAKAQSAAATLIAPSDLKSWHAFAFLIVAAIIWYAAKGPLIGLGVLVGLFWCLNWLCHRFPRTMFWISLIVVEMLAIGRRRR